MYIWTGLVLEDNMETKIRKICKELNEIYKLEEISFSLPQHISLKMSFETKNYEEIIKFIKSILSKLNKMKLNVVGINKINNGVIWLSIEENEKLREIHSLLNNKLKEEYNIPLKEFDGEKFQFHSTLFQDEKICDDHETLIEEIMNKIAFPFEIEVNKICFGISKDGTVGTFSVVDTLILK